MRVGMRARVWAWVGVRASVRVRVSVRVRDEVWVRMRAHRVANPLDEARHAHRRRRRLWLLAVHSDKRGLHRWEAQREHLARGRVQSTPDRLLVETLALSKKVSK